MLTERMVEALRRHWDDGWNAGDLETIMAPFATDVLFSSPFAARLTGDPTKTTIEGHEALRAYVAHALTRTPGIRYTLHSVYAGTDAVILVSSAMTPDGTVHNGADSMRVDATGKVVEWRCHYTGVDDLKVSPGARDPPGAPDAGSLIASGDAGVSGLSPLRRQSAHTRPT